MIQRMMVALVVFLLIGCSTNSGSTTEQPLVQYVTTTPRPTKVAVKPTATVEPSIAEVAPTTVVQVPTTIPAVTITPAPSAAGTAPLVPVVDPGDVLPAPLYLLSTRAALFEEGVGPKQIWRVAPNARDYAKLTNEPLAIESFDISPVTGEIVYTTGVEVIKIASDGSNRMVLWQSESDQKLLNPRWSLDGQEIMLGYGGLALMPATGGQPTVLIPNKGLDIEAATYVPHSWSPDGYRMLISENIAPEGINMLVVDRVTLEQVIIRNEQGLICCNVTWAADGGSIVFGNDAFGVLNPGLWRASTLTGEITSYGTGDPVNGPWLRANSPIILQDGRLLAMTSVVTDSQDELAFMGGTPIIHQLSEVAVDGATTSLNGQYIQAHEALWFPDGTGAVFYEGSGTTSLNIIFVNEPYMQGLLLPGSQMRWGR